MNAAGFRQALWLIKNGMSEELAFSLDPHEALACAVGFGELEGGQFSWESLTWLERS